MVSRVFRFGKFCSCVIGRVWVCSRVYLHGSIYYKQGLPAGFLLVAGCTCMEVYIISRVYLLDFCW